MDAMKQSIGEYVRDNGGNAWVALDHALQKLEAAEAEVARLSERVAKLNRDMSLASNDNLAANTEIVRLRRQVATMRSALEIAAMYVARGLADGAYGNSVVASRALDKINSALDATDNSSQDAPAQ